MIHRQIVTAACAMWLFVGASAAGAQVQVSTGELGPGILPSQALVRPALADITGGKSISAGDFVQRLNRLQYGKELPPATASSLTTEAFVKRNGAGLWENYPPKSGLIANLPLNTRVGWRYNYDSNIAVVLWYQTARWGFIERGSITCCKNDGTPN